ncbi:helix-turn-helix domain-containing protein [Ligilactobacillus murinus]|uniref:helix-turn-helix domain-containing protein n=1 Tax=Ligilactobacillus murinus TaxID=1622 RepID=UPI0027D476F4|nr:helix-turn-helix transcriptional regulator [Ligilactobacillus murinus]
MLWLKIEKELMRQKISVYRLSKNTGISATTLQNYKNGIEPSFKNMCKIANALDVSLDYFRETDDK